MQNSSNVVILFFFCFISWLYYTGKPFFPQVLVALRQEFLNYSAWGKEVKQTVNAGALKTTGR